MSKLQSVPGGGGERAPSAMSMDSASSYEAAHHDHDLHRLRTRLHHAIKETRKTACGLSGAADVKPTHEQLPHSLTETVNQAFSEVRRATEIITQDHPERYGPSHAFAIFKQTRRLTRASVVRRKQMMLACVEQAENACRCFPYRMVPADERSRSLTRNCWYRKRMATFHYDHIKYLHDVLGHEDDTAQETKQLLRQKTAEFDELFVPTIEFRSKFLAWTSLSRRALLCQGLGADQRVGRPDAGAQRAAAAPGREHAEVGEPAVRVGGGAGEG
eukprot:3146004-Rhodomonas_salina.1